MDLFCGFNPSQFSNTPNYGVAFAILSRSASALAAPSRSSATSIEGLGYQEGFVFVLNPPPILGLETARLFGVRRGTAAARATARLQVAVARCRAP